jgi:type VI secretion system protein ImpG
MPQAFGNAQRLLVDATWHQPDFARHAVGPIWASLIDHSILGLDWQVVGPVRAPLDSPIRQDPDQLLYLLSLKMKPTLELEELLQLLSMFGAVDAGVYRELPRRLRDLDVEKVPDGNLQGAGIRHIYHLLMVPHEREEEALTARFLAQLGTILDAWDYEARVEIRAKTGSTTRLALPATTTRKEPGR